MHKKGGKPLDYLNNTRGDKINLKSICPPKPAYLNETQTHPIINWVKWVLTKLNPININVYWVLIGYPIDPIMIQL